MTHDAELWYEAEAPQTVHEAQCYFTHLRRRVRAGERYGRGQKALLSRLGEWFDLNTFHPPELLETVVPIDEARQRFHGLWGHIWEGRPYARLDDECEWLERWFAQASLSDR